MEFIEGARHWWRLRSNQLALLAGLIMGWAFDNRAEADALIALLPENLRPFAGFLLFGLLPILIRMTKQSPPKGTSDV